MVVTTFDGLRVRLDSVMRDGDAWVRLRAEVDEGLVEPAAGDGGGADAAASDGESGSESKDPPESLLPLAEVRSEAERLNAVWQGWAYELPSFKRDYIARRMEELTRPIEESDEEKGRKRLLTPTRQGARRAVRAMYTSGQALRTRTAPS